ncbi:MAG: pyrimidine-nucleoside phosphorylase [Clostridia bacterium]|nr:pyrimidine-nucleoside phosphorylase [Clostridia bacterium]
MRMYDIIYKKRMGKPLTKEEIDFFIDGYCKGTIPDYQASALLMAICINSMTREETLCLTEAMLNSGDRVDLSAIDGVCADKHSTGGVGDKTTLIVAPIVASLGINVAKMSGRGLGFTGGTVDKLESIKGYRATLSTDEFLNTVKSIGICVTGQSGNLTPADKKLYALRDVTATVDSIPLIASSIMSKKLASGADTIVLDVKTGNGAFMKSLEDSCTLAEAMVDIGKGFNKNIRALVTDMSSPLGYFVGNSLEVYEAVSVLKGKSHSDLYELCIELSASIASSSLSLPYERSREMCIENVKNGKAYSKMEEWISAQGGDISYLQSPEKLLSSPIKVEYISKMSGYVSEIHAESVGIASMLLGAGRRTKEDKIDLYAGIELRVKKGDRVNIGDTLAILYTSDENAITPCKNTLDASFEFSESRTEPSELIYSIIK